MYQESNPGLVILGVLRVTAAGVLQSSTAVLQLSTVVCYSLGLGTRKHVLGLAQPMMGRHFPLQGMQLLLLISSYPSMPCHVGQRARPRCASGAGAVGRGRRSRRSREGLHGPRRWTADGSIAARGPCQGKRSLSRNVVASTGAPPLPVPPPVHRPSPEGLHEHILRVTSSAACRSGSL